MAVEPTVRGDLRRGGWDRVVCIATGPSLTREQCDLIGEARRSHGWRVIAVNDAWRLAPFADVLYGCDRKWWIFHGEAVVASGFPGECWSQTSGNEARNGQALPTWVHVIRGEHGAGLHKAPDAINLAGNSGYQAIGLATRLGAGRILLVGYDCQAPGGKRHFFGSHPRELGEAHSYTNWQKDFGVLAVDLGRAGVDVVNCTAATALRCFRRDELNRELWKL